MTRRIIVFDTTLRDGEQAPGNSLSIEEKVRLARQLEVLGVDVIEAGFPASSETDFRSVQEIAAQVRRPVIAALARCTERDIDLAGEAIQGAARGASTYSSPRPTCTSRPNYA
jgi:2-isopropylmalate synthase